jgi:hypothetical protein
MVELRRAQQTEEKKSDKEKRALTELDINLPELKQRRIDDRKLGRPANAHGWEEKLAESKKRGY